MTRSTDVSKTDMPMPTAPATPVVETTDQRVRRWVNENLIGGRIARDVANWNELQAALPALVKIIDA
jgi:hypothetical protein